MNNSYLSPSIYASNLLNIADEIKFLQENDVNNIHFDIMDGNFVNNISLGELFIDKINKNFKDITIDAHLMVQNPKNCILNLLNLDVEIITLHIESDDFENNLNLILDANKKAGIALNPQTPIEDVIPYLSKVDLVLPMSVIPGKSGQKFIDISEKIETLRNLGYKNQIQVDGGINDQTLQICKKSGANSFVIGSYLFNNKENISTINQLIKK